MNLWFVANPVSCASENTTCYEPRYVRKRRTQSTDSYLEVVDDTLAIQKVVGNREEVPVQRFAPGIFVVHLLAVALPLEGEERGDFPVD